MFKSTGPSELPPRPPRAFFGRNELVDQIVDLVENFTPLALIGLGGIGKTSIALTVLHNHRIKKRFGDERRFVRCDQFPVSLSNFLRRLSLVTGAGVENPEDLTPLQPFLSSKEMLVVLDNAESVLDPRGTDAREIYAVVEELGRFDNICLCITSRISTIPPDFETFDIPTLSMEAARDAFHRRYKNSERSEGIDNILKQLEFHPLSITLLATVAHQNRWDVSRLTGEWESQRTGMLRTDHDDSLAATIELSLASPMFQALGSDARPLLEIVAFFPQGVDENKLDWLFPTISNRKNIFDKFCVLSLTHRSNGFVTMLAPLRDHFYPKSPKSSPLLCTTKERYFRRLSVDPVNPNPEEMQWITSEDVNVERVLDVFSSIDAHSVGVWKACADFILHLRWVKLRPTVLGPRIEGLPDGHPSKPRCLAQLAWMLDSLGNYSESKRVLACTVELWRERGNDYVVAETLKSLASVNMRLGHYADGISRAKEALEIYEELDDTVGQADCLHRLALLFAQDNQVDAAEATSSRAMDLFPNGPSQSQLHERHHTLGHICHRRGDTEGAIAHHMKALEIACSLSSQDHRRTGILGCLVGLFLEAGRFDEAQVCVKYLKLLADNDPAHLGIAMTAQAGIWYRQGKIEEARSELSRNISLYEKIGASRDFVGNLKEAFRKVEVEVSRRAAFNP